MYVIDKLYRIYEIYHTSTLDGELSSYLLKNLDDIKNTNLQKCINDTGLSKSFIQKFYTKAGFLSFGSLTSILHHEFTHMIQFQLPNTYDEFEFDQKQIQHLIDCFMKAENIYIYGDYHQINTMRKTTYLVYKLKKNVVFLNTWSLEDSYNVIKTIKPNDMILVMDTKFNAQTFHYITLTNSHMLNFDLMNDVNCHKFFIGSDSSEDYLDFHTIDCPYINDYQSNILLHEFDNLIYENILGRMK